MTHEDKHNLRGYARLALAAIIIQVGLGGWVTSNYAALACADFPTCYGQYWPDMNVAAGFNILQSVGPNYLGGLLDNEARIAIHWMHRLGAVAVVIFVGLLAVRIWSRNAMLAGVMLAVLCMQFLLGTLNVVWTLPLVVATAHNAGGALLLLVVVAVNFAPDKARVA